MKNAEPLFSIIVTSYNDGKYIAECIQSVLAQTYTNWELWIMDDDSSDDTFDMACQYEAKDMRIHAVKNPHVGMSGNRFLGYKKAQGDWITFIDGDDIIGPNLLAIFRDQIVSENCDIVGVFAENFVYSDSIANQPCESRIIVDRSWDIYRNMILSSQEFGLGATAFWGKAYRKELFEKEEIVKWINFTKEICPNTYFDDLAMLPHLFHEAQKASFSKQKIYYHRISCDGISEILSVSTHNYEQLYAMRNKLQYYLEIDEEELAIKEATPIFFNCLSTWYKGRISARNTSEFHLYEKEVRDMYHTYYGLIKKGKVRRLSTLLAHWIIGLWKISPWLWEKVVGYFYFEKKYHYRKNGK